MAEQPSVDNPLGLPLEQDNSPHQLRLTRLEGQDVGRRTNLCTPVLDHLVTIGGTFPFNGLIQLHQVAAMLIREENNTHVRLEAFIQAHRDQRQVALYNSAHGNENAEILFQEM